MQKEDYYKTMSKNSDLCNLHIKACFGPEENISKTIQLIT